MKLTIGVGLLFIDKDLFCHVSGELPPKGKYRVDVSQCPKLMKMTPFIVETGHRIYWNNPDRDLGKCILLDTCDNYIELYKRIVDSINAGEDVILTL